MAFQDFDLIQERRKQVRQHQIKKRITIVLVSIISILLIAAAAVCIIYYKNQSDQTNSHKNPSRKASPEKKHSPPKSAAKPSSPVMSDDVKAVCALTDYKDICETALKGKESESNGFIKASIFATNESIDKAIIQINDIKVDDSFKKSALNDCLILLNDAKDELNSSVSICNNNNFEKEIEKLKPELSNLLSAVMAYQETCIDGIPDSEEKNSVKKSLENSIHHTSNCLAMVSSSQSASILSGGGGDNIKRRLLDEDDFLPTWVDQGRGRNLKADAPTQTPNATVAKDGSGNFTAISDALAAIPQNYQGRYYIFVKEGIYEENVVVTKRMVNLTIYGVGSQKSIVTGSKNIIDGVPTFQTATFVVEGDGFMAQSMGFKNTAGPEKHEAVALRVKSDRSIFLNCRMEGYQSTLFAQTHRQYYRSCYITGTIDIIFGDAAAVFQNCDLYLRKPLENQEIIAISHNRADKSESTGFVLQNCHVLADDQLEAEKGKFKSFLGRPLKNYSRIIIMESEIGDFIDKEGWLNNQNDIGIINSCYIAEFNNKGIGADINGRVKWEGYKKLITKDQAINFTVGPFLQGENWLKNGGVPVRFGLFN